MSHKRAELLTIIRGGTARPEDIEAAIRRTHAEHGDVLQAFHRIFYECGHTWSVTRFLGVTVMKNPLDLWIYQDLIAEQRPKTVLETGSASGGSAYFYASMMDLLGMPLEAKVISVDIENRRKVDHPRIQWVMGDSTDPELAAELLAQVQHPLLVSLDADHSDAHVSQELALYAPAVAVGEYLVIEDTNISWPGRDGGAGAARDRFLRAHPDEWKADLNQERYLVTCNPGGYLRRIAPPAPVVPSEE